jgi:MtfA peptidase
MIFDFFKTRRREKLRALPFPPEWRAILVAKVPYLARLTDAERVELEGHIQIFLAEKSFEGCGGLDLTDEMRVIIAAQACLLLLGRVTDYYPELASILVYPSAYVGKTTKHEGGLVVEGDQARLGESSDRGVVVLAWDDVLRGAYDTKDGHNVVLHEFAHQLDQEDGSADGAPVLSRRAHYGTWSEVLGGEYEHLVEEAERHRKTVMDKYGATNPAEFFAVLTETFFEKPLQLRTKHPELYEQMRGYYKQDPAARLEKR